MKPRKPNLPRSEAAMTASEQGFGGDVTVHVTLDGENRIQALTIDTPNETAGLGQRASEAAFTDQFIGKSGPFTYGENGIEALTGATITSDAALKAINRAAGEEAPRKRKGAEEPAEAPQRNPPPPGRTGKPRPLSPARRDKARIPHAERARPTAGLPGNEGK